MDELVKILAPKLRRLTIPVNYGNFTDYLEITDCMSAADLLEAQAQRIKELEAALRHIQEKAFADLNEPSEMFILHDNDYMALEDYIEEVLNMDHGND